jgi:hypothetical protein
MNIDSVLILLTSVLIQSTYKRCSLAIRRMKSVKAWHLNYSSRWLCKYLTSHRLGEGVVQYKQRSCSIIDAIIGSCPCYVSICSVYVICYLGVMQLVYALQWVRTGRTFYCVESGQVSALSTVLLTHTFR